MNNLREQITGIDVPIQEIQISLYNYLLERWAGTITGYGRVYKNRTSDGSVIPEWFDSNIGTSGGYKSVYYDDSTGSNFCFLVGDNDSTNDGFVFTSNVKCVFAVNLDSLLSSSSNERLDSVVQRDAVEFLRDSDYNTFKITGIQRTIENVYSGYSIENIQASGNIEPLHVFSVNFDLQYYLTDKCS